MQQIVAKCCELLGEKFGSFDRGLKNGWCEPILRRRIQMYWKMESFAAAFFVCFDSCFFPDARCQIRQIQLDTYKMLKHHPVYYTYSNNKKIQTVPRISNVGVKAKCKDFQNKFKEEHDTEEDIEHFQNSFQSGFCREMDIFKHLVRKSERVY